MNAQPEALRLAAALDAYWGAENGHDRERQAAAELRRLHIENEALGLHLSERMNDLSRVEAQRDALLEALQALYDEQEGPPLIRRHRQWQAAVDKARAAIKAVEEGYHAAMAEAYKKAREKQT